MGGLWGCMWKVMVGGCAGFGALGGSCAGEIVDVVGVGVVVVIWGGIEEVSRKLVVVVDSGGGAV